jgi:hypothetical protein
MAAAPHRSTWLGPSFSLTYQNYVAGIILRNDGSGGYGGGSYDILGPAGSPFGYPTVPAEPGDTVELFAVGFGPTNPAVPAGRPFSGSAPVTSSVTLHINNVAVQPSFVGISSAGVYQINFVVPANLGNTLLGTGILPIMATVGGVQTQSGVVFATAAAPNYGSSYGYGPYGFFFRPTAGFGAPGPTGGFQGGTGAAPSAGFGGGTGRGSGGGSGGGSAALRGKPYLPRLQFPEDYEEG